MYRKEVSSWSFRGIWPRHEWAHLQTPLPSTTRDRRINYSNHSCSLKNAKSWVKDQQYPGIHPKAMQTWSTFLIPGIIKKQQINMYFTVLSRQRIHSHEIRHTKIMAMSHGSHNELTRNDAPGRTCLICGLRNMKEVRARDSSHRLPSIHTSITHSSTLIETCRWKLCSSHTTMRLEFH